MFVRFKHFLIISVLGEVNSDVDAIHPKEKAEDFAFYTDPSAGATTEFAAKFWHDKNLPRIIWLASFTAIFCQSKNYLDI